MKNIDKIYVIYCCTIDKLGNNSKKFINLRYKTNGVYMSARHAENRAQLKQKLLRKDNWYEVWEIPLFQTEINRPIKIWSGKS